MEVEAPFVSGGCNRTVCAAAWGPTGLVAFGLHSSIAIYCPERATILGTLPGHKESVNCVEWLPSSVEGSSLHFLSGSADGGIILWRLGSCKEMWRAAVQLPSAHRKSVTSLHSLMLSPTEALVASTSSDSTVGIWSISISGDCGVSLMQIIDVGSRPMLAAAISYFPGRSDHIVLALGGLDNHIHLYSGTRLGQFTFGCQIRGHQDWITCLDFSKSITENENEILYLASSSQDRNVRIWKISPFVSAATSTGLSLKAFIQGPVLRAGEESWQVSPESLLVGHEDWVYSVCWEPETEEGAQPMSVLTSSMDKTMMIWRPEKKTGIWINEVTVGELSHSAFGFLGGLWSPNGSAILAHGLNGSLHLWRNIKSSWQPQLVPSGHFDAVVDVAWAKTGQFLLSASHDQTTRVFACWSRDGESNKSWHEIARPQIHGHDMNCLAVIRGKGNHRYVSGADEKVARVFEASTSFLDTVACITNEAVVREGVEVLGANMSALGLSQKPVYTHEDPNGTADGLADNGLESVPKAVPVVLKEPPLEEHLAQNTLWPETHKLYGHGNELFSMCCSHDGQVIATASKAQSAIVAEIWLWETSSWRSITQLRSHSLTVAQMEFSHNDRFLLSVSRDRHFSLFQRDKKNAASNQYSLLVKTMAHKRIIWTCSWSPCDGYFATGSRDSTVKIWSILENGEEGTPAVKLHTTLPPFQSSVTAVAWSKLLAVGLESGLIELWSSSAGFSCCKRLDPRLCHSATVNRLAWDDTEGDEEDKQQPRRLASCGSDHTVRLFNVTIA